jgi:hypothetical protein
VATIQDDVTADACVDLVAFSHEVGAQTGKKLSMTLAASLLSQAQGVEAALGC